MTRDNKKPITDESYNRYGYFTVAPDGTAIPAVVDRYPDDPTTFPDVSGIDGPIDIFIVRNKSAQDIRVCFDSDASVGVTPLGNVVHSGEDFTFPVRALEYISIAGGDGTDIEVHWFAW